MKYCIVIPDQLDNELSRFYFKENVNLSSYPRSRANLNIKFPQCLELFEKETGITEYGLKYGSWYAGFDTEEDKTKFIMRWM